MANELFRFMSVRPPLTASPQKVVKGDKVLESSALFAKLLRARDAKQRTNVTSRFSASNVFISKADNLRSPIRNIATAIDGIKDAEAVDLPALVANATGNQPSRIVETAEFIDDRRRVVESMLALRLLGKTSSPQYKELCSHLSLLKLTEEADGLRQPLDGKKLRSFLHSVNVEFPQSLRDRGDTKHPENDHAANQDAREASKGGDASGGDALAKDLSKLKEARDKLVSLKKNLVDDNDDEPFSDLLTPETELSPKEQLEGRATLKAKVEARIQKVVASRATLRELDEVASGILTSAGLKLDEDSVPKAIEELTRITKLFEVRAKAQTKHLANTRYVTYQGYIVAQKPTVVGDPLTPLFPSDRVPSVVPPALDVPEGVGYARVLGMGPLHLVREEPKRYELGEIAHIENVMAKERRERKHRRTEKLEEFFSTTTERESENEQDLSSTERFQLRQESTSVINADISLQSGFNLSASYGPTVTVGASTSASVSASSALTKNSASDFSREVTERAKNRVLEKVREERSRRITQEIEEINEHGFDNTSGSTHVIGVYRWVDKIVRAQLLNYGTRLLLEFVIPEPAAFLLKMILDPNSARKSVTVEEPDEQILSLQASDIIDLPNQAHDYRKLASLYHVTDIEPPPLKFVYQADNISFTETDTAHSQTSSKKITIAPDYSAYKVAFTRSRTRNGSEGITLHTATGSAAGEIEDYKRVFELGSVTGELPLVVSYFGNRAVSVNINVYCELTPQAFERWQIKTYKALLEGYQNMKSKFDEQVAAESIRQANQGQGFSPERNRAIERAEIKRSVISMLTGQNFKLFGAIQDGDFPSIDLSQAVPEGKYIEFFENSFEWTNMSYIFYPYFWGRRKFWVDKLGLDNTDMDHLAFLQAGAARVVVPVRLGYDPVVIHYLDTGEIWGGTDVPDLTGVSAPYLDIATEIREQQGNPRKATTVEDEWEVRLPTSLVMLQTDAQLPVFIKDN